MWFLDPQDSAMRLLLVVERFGLLTRVATIQSSRASNFSHVSKGCVPVVYP